MMFDEVTRHAPFPVAIVSRDRLVEEVNESFENMTTVAADELIGARLSDALNVDDRELGAALAADTRSGMPLSKRSGGSIVIRASRISGARTVVALDPSRQAMNGREPDLAQRESDRLQLLLSASVAFANTRSERDLGELLSETARKAFNASACSVHTGEAGSYALVAGENLLEAVWPEGAPSRGRLTVDLGRVVLIESPEAADATFPQYPFGSVLRDAGVVSVLAAPITSEDVQLGAFVCYFDQPRTFDAQAVPLAEALAKLAAQVFVRIRLESQIRRAAMIDEITGLPNRRLFEESFAGAHPDPAEQTAVLFLDLDGFKEVNDRLGHSAGDSVLQQVAERLRAVFRQEDSIARYGGDEFIAAFRVPSPDEAHNLADRARVAISEPYPSLPSDLRVTASIGVAVANVDPVLDPIDRLVRLADQAMYAAKNKGGNQITLQVER
jgi:diguanylate cyclase (GGDEF)-like protein